MFRFLLLCASLVGSFFFSPSSTLKAQDDDLIDPFQQVGEKEGDPDALKPAPDPLLNEIANGIGPANRPEDSGDMKESDEAKDARPLQAQISQHIKKMSEEERDKRLKFMQIVIDDIVRLCALDNSQQDQLELAAKGASERSMKEWHEQAERYFRTRLDKTDPDDAKEMLENMGNVNFGGNRSEEDGETLDLWKDSVSGILTEEQITRYEEVVAIRREERVQAFAQMSLSTIDQHIRLTPDQKESLGEIVLQASDEYLDDVQRYWGDYFERGMLMSLANAAEAEDLKKILTESQFDRHKEATANFEHFWDQKRKLKRAKRKAAVRRKEKSK